MTLEQYLRLHVEQQAIDFALRASIAPDGRVAFYLHPQDVDGETIDLEVAGNVLSVNRDVVFPANAATHSPT